MLPVPPDGYESRDQAETLIKNYLFGGKYDLATLPKRLKPADADDFLQKAFAARPLNAKTLQRAVPLMAFYDLRARAAQLAAGPPPAPILDKNEKTEPEYVRSLAAIEIIGDFGDPHFHDLLLAYYKHLCNHELALKFYPQLVDLFVHLPPGADLKPLSEALAARARKLEPEANKGGDEAVEYFNLKDLQEDRLPTILKARKKREDILAIKDDHKRHIELGLYYTGLEKFAYVDMVHFAVIHLQRDCDLSSPPPIAADLTTGLAMIKSQADKREPLPASDKADLDGYVTRCARAIDFYHGPFPAELLKYFAAHEQDHIDILHWEPFASDTRRPDDYYQRPATP